MRKRSACRAGHRDILIVTAMLAGLGFAARVPAHAHAHAQTATPERAQGDAKESVQQLGKIKVEAEAGADGSVEQGYRSDTVSAVGPWQGRSLQDTPYSITVIPQELIRNLQATTPEQIYRVVPTASVEIFSGLSGFLYGPGNVGGMVNYVSKRPTAERLNRATLGNNGGSNYYAQGDFGGPIDSAGRFGYRINGIWQDGETAVNNMDIDASVSWSQPWKHSRSEMQRYGTQLRWEANEAFTLRAAWLYAYTRRPRNEGVLNFIQPDGTYTQIVRNQYAPGDDTFAGDLSSLSGQAFADIHFKTAAIAHNLTMGVQYQNIGSKDFTESAPGVVYTGLTFDRPTYFDKPVVAHVDRGLRVRDTAQSNTTLLIGDTWPSMNVGRSSQVSRTAPLRSDPPISSRRPATRNRLRHRTSR